MGRVYLATQLPLERQVAIKLLVNQRHDAEFRKRFFLEASTCARLVHRHIVTVHDYGEADDGELFMAMEYLDGIPLSKVIQRQVRLTSGRACKIALQVCRALRTAHKTGVVHRDLKPGNVIVLTDEEQDGNDFIKVLDFGLVKAFEGDSGHVGINDLTKSGTWLGSPRYMAPEQIRCQPVDPRTDIYSLGVILFHMLAGRPPFIGSNSMEVLEQHLRDKPPSIAEVLGRSDYAPELEVIVERCLRKDPSQRYQSMDELIGDLKAAYRLITGVSLHTESTLPTFAEIAEPPLGMPAPPIDMGVQPVPTNSFSVGAATDTAAWRDPSNSYSARVTGTIRAPLELLETSNVTGRQERLASAMPAHPMHDPSMSMSMSSMSGSFVDEDGSVVLRAPTLRWGGLVAALLVVMLMGFFSVKLFGPKPEKVVTVRIDSQPRGAEVVLDGRRIGITPVVHPMRGVAPGTRRTFIVRKKGHEDVQLSPALDGEQVDLHAALVPVLPASAPIPTPPVRVAPARPEPVRAARGADSGAEVEPPPKSTRARRRDKRRKERDRVAKDTSDRSRNASEPSRSSSKERRRARERRPEREVADRRRSDDAARPSNRKKTDSAGKKASVRAEDKRRSLVIGSEADRVVKESTVPIVE